MVVAAEFMFANSCECRGTLYCPQRKPRQEYELWPWHVTKHMHGICFLTVISCCLLPIMLELGMPVSIRRLVNKVHGHDSRCRDYNLLKPERQSYAVLSPSMGIEIFAMMSLYPPKNLCAEDSDVPRCYFRMPFDFNVLQAKLRC